MTNNTRLKSELKAWGIYFSVLILATFVHELGHCIVAWVHGLKAIPTLAKEYPLEKVPDPWAPSIALGGILGSVIISLLLIILFWVKKNYPYRSSLLAGAVGNPGIYSFLFLLKGRGHDQTEFQDAQAALGLSYSGHFVDWLFVLLFLCGSALWFLTVKPRYTVLGRLLLGAILTLAFLISLQEINNRIFDPLFQTQAPSLITFFF